MWFNISNSPNSVSTLWVSYGGFRSGVLRGVHFRPSLSTAQARTEFRLRRQYRTEWLPRDGADSLLPANVLATSTKYCACHDFHKVSDSLHLPRNSRFDPPKPACHVKPRFASKRARTPGKSKGSIPEKGCIFGT